MESQDKDSPLQGDISPRARGSQEDARTIRGFRRRLSESARDAPGEGLYRLVRLGSGLRRRLSGSTRDIFSSVISPAGIAADEDKLHQSGLQRHLSASMKDLLLQGGWIGAGMGGVGGGLGPRLDEGGEGIGRKLSRRLSLLAGTVASRADQTRGSLRARLPNLRRSRSFTVSVILPDSSSRTVLCESGQTAGQAMSQLAQELRLATFSLALADSQAEVDLDAPAHLLDGDTVLLHDAIDTFNPSIELEPRLRMAVVLAATERTLCGRMRCVEEVYGRHLRRLSSVTHDEHNILFNSISPVVEESEALVKRLEAAIINWNPEDSCLGALFIVELWDAYETYLDQYQEAIGILREKHSNDEEFVALCKLRRGAARHSLLHLLHLPVERLSEYEQYFASLLVDTHPDHPDRHHLSHHHDRLTQLVRRGEEEESEIERIQELFPHDDLRLYERDPVTQKMKGLMRKRSTTAARLQRAFSAKGLRGPDHQHNNNKDTANNNNTNNATNTSGGLPPNRTREGKPKRQFIMETPATFTTGVQSQERHLFLFSDLLLVAKARSGGNFKLKEKVRVSELWLSSCLDDVAETAKSHDTSFVMGWPTTNVVASFSCVATKDLWYNKLCQVMTEERDKEPPSTTIQVTYYDPVNSIDFSKTVNIGSTTTARECVSLTLDHLEMGGADTSQFQLWVKTGVDDSPYPLIGHEYPFAIKMNCVRDLLQDCDAEQCNNLYNTELVTRCQFILRQARKLSFESPEGVKKVSKKARKSPMRIHKVFKRSNSKGDSIDGSVNSCGVLYGRSLVKLVEPENMLPKPVMDMFSQLFLKGPFTVGIFRKSANARLVRELREKLDSGEADGAVDIESLHITVVAALLKDFLRSMPDCLLVYNLYEEWLELTHIKGIRERISQTLLLCSRLPRAHLKLLQYFLCVLHHIVRRASENMMSASNLAVCVGPSILRQSSPVLSLSPETSKQVPAIIEFLIERCVDIFGEDILHLLGEPPERDPMRQDSGAEESDSLHSLHSGHSLHSSGGMRRDDSSIDSLERELLEGELSPLPRKDKMSLTNLSRDSGLTMSDSQLYTPDEEESESTSSGHSGADKSVSNYSSGGQSERSGDKFQHYSAPNNPHAIYAAVYRRPEKVPIGYDDPESYYAAPSRDHARIQVTYSTPGYSHGPHGQGKEYTRVYQSRHDRLGDVYRKCQEEEAIYSIPVGASGNMINPPPFVVNSNFQRHDWMRRRSNLRKVSRSSSGDGGLVRSTSEESLLNKYNGLDYGVSLGPAGITNPNKRPAQHGKGRAPPPPPGEENEDCTGLGGRESPIRRSKSAHYLTEPSQDDRIGRSPDNTPAVSRSSSHDAVSWHRSRSTPQIHDEADRSYDSSTLSDDDSTPHVSRSNSRGKECGGGGLNTWDVVYGTEHTKSDSGESHNSCNSSFKSERTGSMCTVVSAGSTSTLGSNPPSYEEALNRRSLMFRNGAQQGHQGQGSPSGKDVNFSEYAIREEKVKSARAKQLYEESLRIYQEETTYTGDLVRASPAHADVSDDYERPPPLPPKSEAPPLPPKQRGSRRLSDGLSRLKHLPPVHVETHARKSRSVSSLPTSYGCDPPYHKTIIYTDDSPPSLPPKERTVIEIESAYLQMPESRVRQTTSRAVSPPRVEKKSIETQTDDYDLDDEVKDEGIQTSGSWVVEPHVTSVSVPDQSSVSHSEKHRSRARRRDSSTSHRSKSVPTRDNVQVQHPDSEDDDDEDDWEYTSPSLQDFPGGPAALRDLRQLDPDLRQEISWSVSQLRAIFGETLKGAKVHPPPYRPPPSSHRAPITSYHLGAGDSFTSRKSRPHSNYGEESYV